MRLCMLADTVERACVPCLPSCFLTMRCSEPGLSVAVGNPHVQRAGSLSLVVRCHLVHHTVTSRFSISSSRLDAVALGEIFSWRVAEVAPAGEVDYHVTVFDLGLGEHDRVDHHLVAAKAALLQQEPKLDSLRGDCKYALWVSYRFPAKDGAINVSPAVSAAFGLLGVELICHLTPQ